MSLLALRGVSRHFGGVRAVDGIDLDLEEGEILGLIGPNGAGKTTVFNLISGILVPTAGSIAFAGRPLVGLAPHAVTALGIGRTFQNIRLFREMSSLENVMAGAHCRGRAGLLPCLLRTAAQRREEAALRELARELLAFVGLEARADAPAGSLPYGQQRRLEIARALAAGPRVLLLDEPAAGMNESERRELMELIRALRAQGRSILLIEHDMNVVMNICDRVAVLNFGRKIADGPPEAVKADPAVIEAYLGREEG